MMRIYSILAGLTLTLLLSSCLFEPPSFEEQQWLATVENTDRGDLYAQNFRNGTFINPWLVQQRSFLEFLRWRFTKSPSYGEEAENNRPEVIPGLLKRIDALDPAEEFLVWIGHGTFLFRLQGEYWLTDPIFTERALVPKRITPPAMRAGDVAGLNGRINVLLSHNHYDHLDKASLQGLPENTSFVVPKGLGNYVASFVEGPVTEMNWWDELELEEGTIITCLPAQHWSRRLFQGYNTTLWASYMVESAGKTIYFGGDSGYFKGYREIGELFMDIDYALLPITAYEPRWFMHYPHIDTGEAIRAFEELGAESFIPTQWGTFRLGDNPPGLPPLDLQNNIEEMRLDPKRFLILDIGQIHLL